MILNRGRFQAQDNKLEESVSWSDYSDIKKKDGHNYITSLKNLLSKKQLTVRKKAFLKAQQFVNQAPSDGYNVIGLKIISKNYFDDPYNREVRVDVEIRGGIAFIDN